jgi:hypothetical protein
MTPYSSSAHGMKIVIGVYMSVTAEQGTTLSGSLHGSAVRYFRCAALTLPDIISFRCVPSRRIFTRHDLYHLRSCARMRLHVTRFRRSLLGAAAGSRASTARNPAYFASLSGSSSPSRRILFINIKGGPMTFMEPQNSGRHSIPPCGPLACISFPHT